MSACWKCELELPDGQMECDPPCSGFNPENADHVEAMEEDFRRNWMEVDWTKVETLQDLITLISKYGQPIFICKTEPEFERLKKYLKPID